jgi:hypothetical protein
MPGVVSYFVSRYTMPSSNAGGVTPVGEFVVVRTDGKLGKAYNFVFGTSTNQEVFFTTPYKSFPDHHFRSDVSVSVEVFFGNSSGSK